MAYNEFSLTAPADIGLAKPYPSLPLITPQMFGAVADCNGITGTDNVAAFNTWLAYCLRTGRQAYLPAGWYYCSAPLNVIIVTAFQGGFSIKGDWMASTYEPNQIDSRIFWNATAGQTFLSFTSTVPADDSYNAIYLSDFAIQASNTSEGNGTGAAFIGVRPYISRFGSIFNSIGIDAENSDLMRSDGCYIVRNKVAGIRTSAIFEWLDTCSVINSNNTNSYGGSAPYTGANYINTMGAYSNQSFGHTFIRTNFNSGPGVIIDNINDVTFFECEFESNGDGTGASLPLKAGANGFVTNLRILNSHFQSQPIYLDRVVGGLIEAVSPVNTTANTANIELKSTCNPLVGATVFPSNYRMTTAVTDISPNFCVDGDLVHANKLNYGSSGTSIPSPIMVQTGASPTISTASSTPLITGRKYISVTTSGASTVAWANNLASYSPKAGTYVFLDVICRNGTGVKFPDCQIEFVDSASVVNTVNVGNFDSTSGYQIALHDGWVQFSLPIQISTGSSFGNVAQCLLLFVFSGAVSAWEIAYCGLGIGFAPKLLPTNHAFYPFQLTLNTTFTLSGLASAGYGLNVTNASGSSATVGYATSGSDIVVSASAGPTVVNCTANALLAASMSGG